MTYTPSRYLALLALVLETMTLSAQSTHRVAPAQVVPQNWHRHYSDSLQGMRSDEALQWLIQRYGRPRTILVGVVDTGVDTTLTALRPSLWLNPKERPNGLDDDRDGYVDNRYGWNFLGSQDGSLELTSVGTEAYREYKRLYPKYKDITTAPAGFEEEWNYFREMERKTGIQKYRRLYTHTVAKDSAYRLLDAHLRQLSGARYDSLQLSALDSLPLEGKALEEAGELIGADLVKAGGEALWVKVFATHRTRLEQMEKRLSGIEYDLDKRTLLGDRMEDVQDRHYGNANVSAPGADHGTFVSSVIALQPQPDSPLAGVYPAARLINIRAVPDQGDEYDKDVASAIYYAVQQGAKVINLSLGKDLSPSADLVRSALDWAAKRDVVIVHSSGNNGRDLDAAPIYPEGVGRSSKPLANYLRIGASTKLGTRASFSNYGKSVTLCAPGQEIYGLMAGGRTSQEEGTSIAAPLTAAVAAMIRAYFPRLTAPQVVEILHTTARQGQVPIVDALAAVQRAAKLSHRHPTRTASKRK